MIGALSLYLLFIWLASAIVSAYLSERKGYGERAGLASGLLLSVVGVVIWLVVPAKQSSDWRVVGPMPWQRQQL
jgi:fucose permease